MLAIRSFQFRENSVPKSFCVNPFHTIEVNRQLKNRWSLVSTGSSQKMHRPFVPPCHCIIRSPVDSLFFTASHVQKVCFGVALLNQIPFDHATFGLVSLMLFQVSFVLNL
ncbi:hypothetical protein Bca4012_019189 [Brassica carinata]